MPYFQLRITFSESRTQDRCIRAIKSLISNYNLAEYSTGIEEFNKYGEPCSPHVHFNFIADIDRINPKRCIQDWLRRYFANLDVELKGNKQWSLQMVEEPKDYDRWFRYPLKEGPRYQLISKTSPPFYLTMKEGWKDKTPFDEFCHLAKTERKDAIAANILHREKVRNKDQFKKKLYEFIDEECKEGEADKRVIWTTIFQYYRKIEKPINFSVIEGYTNLWLADHGKLSADSAFDLAHFNNNN